MRLTFHWKQWSLKAVESQFQTGERKKNILKSPKLFFKNEGDIKTFPDKQILREFLLADLPYKKY